MMSIHTVAAGGGSILQFDGSRCRVGPASAGADPGPASYRRGGPLTVTDANVMLGRIQPDHFPHVFGADGAQPLDAEVVRREFDSLAERIRSETGDERPPEEVAAGFSEIAVANMANAINKISVQRGYDVTEYTLATFGGAGGQHACAVADALGMTTVLIHPLAGVLSAYGMGLADVTAMRQQAIEAPLSDETLGRVADVVKTLETEARQELTDEGVAAERIRSEPRALLRYDGTDTTVAVEIGSVDDMLADFEAAYRRQFSFLMPDKTVVVEAVSVELLGEALREETADALPPGTDSSAQPAARVEMFVGGSWTPVDLYQRDGLRAGDEVEGPAIVAEANATTVVEPGWQATVNDLGTSYSPGSRRGRRGGPWVPRSIR
jgi:5-oxoprolinase (ATP-hydrolysing)